MVAQTFLDQVFKPHDMPKNIVSDKGPIFMSRFWQELFSAHEVKLNTSTTYHPQTDGPNEVLNRLWRPTSGAIVVTAKQIGPFICQWQSDDTIPHSTHQSRPLPMTHCMGNLHQYICSTWLVKLLMKK